MYNKTNHKARKYFCMDCLQRFTTEDVLNKYKSDCILISGNQAIKVPKIENRTSKFNIFI